MFLRFISLILCLLLVGVPVILGQSVQASTALPCSATGGTWTKGELNVYVFDVEQGDSMLVVGPNAKTILIDLGETRFNTTGSATNATSVANKIKQICGTGQNPVLLDYFIATHLHLDHIGYAANPSDTTSYGNGIYQLLNGLGFRVNQFITRDAGTWTDRNGNGRCEPGKSNEPTNEINWTNVGTISTTATRFLCWVYGPDSQPDRASIRGRVLTVRNNAPWPVIDLGSGAKAEIVNANGKGSFMVDGVTPISGNYANLSAPPSDSDYAGSSSGGRLPPSENDYSIAVKLSYGKYVMATSGDTDGEYSTSRFGYTYNDIEARLGPLFGNVDTYRVNHHGSQHSSNAQFLATLRPETAIISCGANTYGHPTNPVLDRLRRVPNDRGTGADIFLTNNPCSPTQSDGSATNYSGVFGSNGDVVVVTTNQGAGYRISYPGGSRTYTAYGNASSSGGTAGDPSKVVINEYMMAPNSGNEWVELYNPTNSPVTIGGLYVDDIPGGTAPKQIPSGTTIPAKGYYVLEVGSAMLNNTGYEEVRFLKLENGTETVYDKTSYNLSTARNNQVFFRTGDGGSWCNQISSRITRGTANPTTCP